MMPTTEHAVAPALDFHTVRAQFPSLAQTVNGTQVPRRVIDAIAEYLRRDNANTGGAYATSRHTDAMIAGARAAMADFLNCGADEVVFGPNMTSLTFAISRAIGRDLGPGDEILVTRLDHDANVSPWLALAERGVTIRWAEIREPDCTLDMTDLAGKIGPKTKLVAVGYASNAVGTINPVKEIVRLAHAAGALAYIDAVHFGPHMGVLYGKREHLQRLKPYKVRPNTNAIPNCWEWGTLNHECIAGIAACVEYFDELGRRTNPAATTRRAAIVAAHEAIHQHERGLIERIVRGLTTIPGLKLYGITDPARFNERCGTFAVRIEGHAPLELATKLGDRGFFTWDGNYYALNLTEQLDVEKTGGFLRIGLVHYNTVEEVDRLLEALRELVTASG